MGFGKYHAEFVGGYSMHASSRLSWALVYIVLLAVSAYAVGLPDLHTGVRSAAAAAVTSTVAAAGGISLIQLVTGSLLLPRFVVFSSALVLVPWYALCAGAATDGRDRDENRDRILAVVGPAEAEELEADLADAAERPATLVGVLDAVLARPAEGRRPIAEWVRDRHANVIVLDRLAASDDSIVEQVAQLHEDGTVRVRTLTLFYDEWLGKLPLPELERVSLMFDIGEMHRARYGRIKRLFDIVAGVVGLVVLAVAAPVIAIGNVFANRGSLFFRQERVGRNGAPFSIVKLRSMRSSDTEVDSGAWTCEDDPRITTLGRWLRRSHLDELPQAWNLLRGDLSVCGPRPEQPRYVTELTQKIPFYNLRHLVRPGLTGWAQVKYDYGSTDEDALEKLQYEFWYLRHQTLVLDARIMVRTLRSVVGRSGR
jgi:lipopolysaccharide/colanic/teichoic acid biosynthesis glycosyltransferase